jgi:hypothetical protein
VAPMSRMPMASSRRRGALMRARRVSMVADS